MLLYTNHLPLNKFLHEFLKKKEQSPLCDDAVCSQNNLDETMHHFICICPKYEQIRNVMINDVKQLWEIVNSMINDVNTSKIKKKRKKINFVDDIQNVNYLKQFLFPDFTLKNAIRIKIIKQVIHFVIATNRINLNEKYL